MPTISPKPASDPALGRSLTALRRNLLSLAPDCGPLPAHLDKVRRAALSAAKMIGPNLNQYWGKSAEVVGPVDVIDMFSGCGGMSAGFRAVNGLLPAYKLALAVDIDNIANNSYHHNIGVKAQGADVSRLAVDSADLEKLLKASGRRPGHPLVLIGCAPCQGFSSHRNRKGNSDTRNSLFADFAKIATKLKPDAIVVENVPELLTDGYWPYVREARKTLTKAGYQVHIGVHNMAEYGVPQERFRAVLLAFPRAFRPPGGFLNRQSFRTVREAIGGLPPVAAGEKRSDDPMHYSAGHQDSTLRTIRAVPLNGGNRPADVGPECLRRGAQRQGKAMYEDVYGRLHWDKPAITITAYARNPASGRFVHPEQHRGLSVREAALLQGFPASYWFAGSLDERFRQIGNAVPPMFSCYLAAYILGELLGRPIDGQTPAGIDRPIGRSFSRMIPGLKSSATHAQPGA